jgi:NAD(P)-dependent dehydrogenase (short-subunit alcohol dehydrogenase family)
MSHTAVIAGVGPGLGESLARRFHEEGCSVGVFARSSGYLSDLEGDFGERALAIPTDTSDADQVADGFDRIREAFGPVDVLVNHASSAPWAGLTDIDHAEFERALQVGAAGALYCSQEAVNDMLANVGGTVIFTGATTATRGREGAIGFSAAKFAARGMAESMARELGPEGIHVAHVVIDGQIGRSDGSLDPDEIARQYWHLVEQDRSTWTLELDLRPHVESF